MRKRLDRISERAESHPEESFNNLLTLITLDMLHMAFSRLKEDKSPGLDGQSVGDYRENLESNLQDLLQRIHRGSYRPQPSLRREIPKENGKTRSLGLACVEDKIVQRTLVMILERIYEVDLLFCWLRRRSQMGKQARTWESFYRWLEIKPLINPVKLTVLIAAYR
ncbi:MAG: hypothetical protein ACK506_18440 [Pirellula sp.]